MHVTLLRHAESVFNKYLTSDKDCDLTEAGQAQAYRLTDDYDTIIVSCLRRTHQTLMHSRLTAKRILMTDLCREKRSDICDFLEYEDETRLESDDELAHRIDCFKEYLRRNCGPDEKVLVICHGDFIFAATGKTSYPDNAEMRPWTL